MTRSNLEPKTPAKRQRCAINTRKSTEEGLEQEFNSLDAQREAAEAYILSQRREGWSALPQRYDDGGFTGANMDRPALTRLLAAVESGELDCVVVYKVDRLSRSLLDFTRILSLFEKHNVSFVAVTQQFNTSTSLGRLTLNILLSFAQFAREMIGERTRDKMAAARKKGRWVGGCPVLGYDLDTSQGRLVVNEAEAEQARTIFGWFAENGSIPLTLAEIEQRGWKLKSWTRRLGGFRERGQFTALSLRRLLGNILYTGAVRYKRQIYPGQQAAILAAGVWEEAQERIANGKVAACCLRRNKHHALLQGLLYCDCCAAPMVYSYPMKKDRKYPYYVCRAAQRKGWAACPRKSLPARAIEDSVLQRVRETKSGIAAAAEWEQMERAQRVAAMRAAIERIGYDGNSQRISIRFHEPLPAAGQEAHA